MKIFNFAKINYCTMIKVALKLMLLLMVHQSVCAEITGAVSSKLTPAPVYTFRPIGLYDGLPENYIGSVFRLPDGRMTMRATDLIP